MKTKKSPKTAHTGNPKKSSGDWHVNHSSMGMGDYYGTGVKQPLGKMRSSYTPGVNATSKKGLKTPPKSLA